MKKILLCGAFAFGTLLFPACETEREVTTTTTTEETLVHPSAASTTTTTTQARVPSSY